MEQEEQTVALTINAQFEVVRKLWNIQKIWSGGQSSVQQQIAPRGLPKQSRLTQASGFGEGWAELRLNVNCN